MVILKKPKFFFGGGTIRQGHKKIEYGNALFFTDKTIHKIYQDKGEFNFLYQLPQILYSTLIGKFIDSLIKNLGLTQDYIIALKHIKIKKI